MIGGIALNRFFDEVKKNFGFGCMRLPMKNGEVNYVEFTKTVYFFIGNGFNYFDTAHGYVGNMSETALREYLTSRYPGEAYILTDKLSTHHFNKREELRSLLTDVAKEFDGGDTASYYYGPLKPLT